MSNPVKPTLGRIVLLTLATGVVAPAIVTGLYTHDENTIDATAFPAGAAPVHYTKVAHDDNPYALATWRWMDYQKGQAAKADALQVQLTACEASAGLAGGPTPSRRVMGHEVNPCNSKIMILADGPGPGGASHEYDVYIGGSTNVQKIAFQNGPVLEDGNGVNGTTHEVLLTIVADRLQGFQAGPYACPENAAALEAVGLAMSILHRRTLEREARGVEGTHKV